MGLYKYHFIRVHNKLLRCLKSLVENNFSFCKFYFSNKVYQHFIMCGTFQQDTDKQMNSKYYFMENNNFLYLIKINNKTKARDDQLS